MQLHFSRTAAVLVAALAVAGCGTQRVTPPAASQTTPPAAGQNGSASFVARARQVTAQWDKSQAARAWRTGLVLLDPSELVPVPRNQGFNSQQQKDAFGSGHFRLTGALPAQPLPGLVRWADGTTQRLPVLTAPAAFAELAAQHACGGPSPCGQLTVTGAQPATVTILTSRGPASVPAWRFTVTDLGWPVSEVAVAPSALVVLPGDGPIPPAGRNTPGVTELAAVSADGRTLTVQLLGGACDAAWGAYRYETGQAIVIGSWVREKAGQGWCATVGILRTVHVTLTRPLGNRAVLDVASGQPLVRGFQLP
jgi:hypothetical protein